MVFRRISKLPINKGEQIRKAGQESDAQGRFVQFTRVIGAEQAFNVAKHPVTSSGRQ